MYISSLFLIPAYSNLKCQYVWGVRKEGQPLFEDPPIL